MSAPDPTSAERVAGPGALRAIALVVFSACCFGSISILTVIATRGGATLTVALVGRYAIATLFFVLVSGGLRPFRIPPRRAVELSAIAGAGQAAIAYISLSSLDYITASTLAFLFYTYPAWVTLMSAVRGVERIDTAKAGALALSLTGIVVLVGTPGASGLHPVGVSLALASALLYAIYIQLVDRWQRGLHPAVTSGWISFGVAVIMVMGGIATETLAVRLQPAAWGAIAGLAILSTGLAFLAFLRGLAALGPVRTAIISTIEPFWTALLGAFILSQPLSPRTAVGGALIATAVVLLQRAAARGAERRT